MPALITNGSKTLTPLALSAYTAGQDGGSIRHDILGRATPDVTLRPLGMRTGSFDLDFISDTLANTARVTLTAASSWTLTHSERASINMRFIVRRLGRVLEGNGRWSISVEWEEVP